jgi:anti-sigma factor RsiW
MTDVQAPGHVTAEELAAYFAGQLRPEQETSFDEHFAECEACAQEARRFRSGLEVRFCAFATIWDRWTASAHQEVHQRAILNAILQQVTPLRPEWQERLRRWRERWNDTAESALRSIRDAATEVSRVVIAPIEMSVPGGGEWRFALATEAPSVSGSVRSGGVPVRGAVSTNRRVSLEAEKPQERVVVSSDIGEIEVSVEGWQPGRPLSLVLLINLQGENSPLVQELTEERAGVAVAHFSGVEPGEYLVAFEPVE